MSQEDFIPEPPVNPTGWLTGSTMSSWLKVDRKLVGGVLQHHLAVEEMMTHACERRLKKPSEILGPRSRMMFAQKLKLLKSLYSDEIDASIYRFMKELNVIRNRLAHGAKDADILQMLSEIQKLEVMFSKPGDDSRNRGGMPSAERSFVEGEEDLALEMLTYKVFQLLNGLSQAAYSEEVIAYEVAMEEWMEKHIRPSKS